MNRQSPRIRGIMHALTIDMTAWNWLKGSEEQYIQRCTEGDITVEKGGHVQQFGKE